MTSTTTSPMPSLRGGRSGKLFALLTLGFFTWFNVHVAAAAIKNEVETPSLLGAAISTRDAHATLVELLEAELDRSLRQLKPARDRVIKAKRKDPATGAEILDITILGTPEEAVTAQQKRRIARLAEDLTKEADESLQSFERARRHVSDHKLSGETLDRVNTAQNAFVERHEDIQKNLQSIGEADTVVALYDHISSLSKKLSGWNREAHSRLDPENLPFGLSKAAVRTPMLTPLDLKKAIEGSNPAERVSAERSALDISSTHLAQIFAEQQIYPIERAGYEIASARSEAGLLHKAGMTAPGPEYLAATLDAQITPEIQAKAQELGNDPIRIYNWVRNTIEFLPTYGSIQGSSSTMRSGRGNAFDTASLLVALLRAAGTPARYVYGTVEMPASTVMNWVGGVSEPAAAQSLLAQGGVPNASLRSGGRTVAVRLEHVWVEAFVDFYPSKGAKNVAPDAWVPMDASLKQYSYAQPINIESAVTYDWDSFAEQLEETTSHDASGTYISGVDTLALQDMANDVRAQLEEATGTEGDQALLLQKEIIAVEVAVLAGSLPYKLVQIGQRLPAYSDFLRHKVQISTNSGLTATLVLPSMGNQKVSLRYDPATASDQATVASYGGIYNTPPYMVSVRPRLLLSGQEISQATALQMGEADEISIRFIAPQGNEAPVINNVLSGGIYSVALTTGEVLASEMPLITQRAATLQQLRDQSSQSYGDDDIGEQFYLSAMTYFFSTDVQVNAASRVSSITNYKLPAEAMFGFTYQTGYRYGIPVRMSPNGAFIDVDRNSYVATSRIGVMSDVPQFITDAGGIASANEHGIFEQGYRLPGISTIKVLDVANRLGKRIFTITAANISGALSQLTVPANIKSDVQTAINAGLTVTIPESLINFEAWTGTGYIATDPVTGSSAYRISGGLNGGGTASPGDLFVKWVDFAGCIINDVLETIGEIATMLIGKSAIQKRMVAFMGRALGLASFWIVLALLFVAYAAAVIECVTSNSKRGKKSSLKKTSLPAL